MHCTGQQNETVSKKGPENACNSKTGLPKQILITLTVPLQEID